MATVFAAIADSTKKLLFLVLLVPEVRPVTQDGHECEHKQGADGEPTNGEKATGARPGAPEAIKHGGASRQP